MTDAADPRAAERVGSVLDEKWTLEHLIGSGGMGAVYAARHRNGARAAVKILHPELARMPDVRERFLREGYAANRVEHRGVVQVLDDDIVKSGEDEGSAYLVMELLEGDSLQERTIKNPLGERELLEVMDAVLDVLAAAHAKGVIHRDLKPENIFLATDPEREGVRVKVLDFGLARLVESSGVTNAGIAIGTPSFMSPEQAAGRSADIDGRTDVFALGATIFRIVSGRRIHDADNMVQLVVLMATTPAPPLLTVAPKASPAFARIVDGALTFERDARWDARAMQAAVRAALDELPSPASSVPKLQIIPASTRNLRASGPDAEGEPPPRPASAPAIPPIRASAASLPEEAPPPAPPPPAPPSSEEEVAPPSSERPRRRRGSPPVVVTRSATLPWVLVLLLLAIGAWKLGPSLQDELVRRASQWTAPAPTTTSSGAPSAEPAASANATSETLVVDAGGAPPNDDAGTNSAESADAGHLAAADLDDSSLVIEDLLEAGAPHETAAHDAGAPHTPSAARHVDHPPSRASKPPPKKPPPAPPPKKRPRH